MDPTYVPRIYGWLGLLRMLADRRAASAMATIGMNWESDAVRAMSRTLVEEYLDDGNPYQWNNEATELARIEKTVRDVVGPDELEAMRTVAITMADESLVREAIVWSRVIKTIRMASSDRDSERPSAELKAAAQEFLRAIAEEASDIEPDEWDDWFLREQPVPDPMADLWGLKRTLAYQAFSRRLVSLAEADRAALRQAVSSVQKSYHVPTVMADRLYTQISSS